jgi:hypothetical protein
VRLCPWTAATIGPFVHLSDDVWVWRSTMERHWQGKHEKLGEKPVPVSLRPPQIPHWLTLARNRASAMRGWRLTAWAMARPPSTVSAQNSCSLGIPLKRLCKLESDGGMILTREKRWNRKKNLSQCHFVHYKSHMDWPGREPGSPQWEASDWTPEPWHCPTHPMLHNRHWIVEKLR